MLLTQKLIRYLPRTFLRIPQSVPALAIAHTGALSWSIADAVLTTAVAGVPGAALEIDLAELTLQQLADAINAHPGYTATLAPGVNGSVGAWALLDGAGAAGDSLAVYAAIEWSFIDAFARALTEAAATLVQMLRQLRLDLAEGEWLEFWGGRLLGTGRGAGETDAAMRNRVTSQVLTVKSNNRALEEIVRLSTGVDVEIVDIPWALPGGNTLLTHGGGYWTALHVTNSADYVCGPNPFLVDAAVVAQFGLETLPDGRPVWGDLYAALPLNAAFAVIFDENATPEQVAAVMDVVHVNRAAGTVALARGGAITVPGAPRNVSATTAPGTVTVAFDPPASNGGAQITSYTVTVAIAGTGMDVPIEQTGSGSPITVTGLTNGQTYNVHVRATNAVGTGPASSPPVQVTPTVSTTTPSAPQNVSAVAGDGQATVSFSPPASNGGSTITGYTVTSSPDGIMATGSASPITVTGLTNGTGYSFTVTATNAAGTGPEGGPSNVVTPLAAGTTAPGAPQAVAATGGDGEIRIHFRPPASDGGAPVTGYTVVDSGSVPVASGTGSPITVSGLINGVGYSYRVVATNAAGTGPASSPSNVITPKAYDYAGTIGGPPNNAVYEVEVAGIGTEALNMGVLYVSGGSWTVHCSHGSMPSSPPTTGTWKQAAGASNDYLIDFNWIAIYCDNCSPSGSGGSSAVTPPASLDTTTPAGPAEFWYEVDVAVLDLNDQNNNRASRFYLHGRATS
jgi:hypothetical protein